MEISIPLTEKNVDTSSSASESVRVNACRKSRRAINCNVSEFGIQTKFQLCRQSKKNESLNKKALTREIADASNSQHGHPCGMLKQLPRDLEGSLFKPPKFGLIGFLYIASTLQVLRKI